MLTYIVKSATGVKSKLKNNSKSDIMYRIGRRSKRRKEENMKKLRKRRIASMIGVFSCLLLLTGCGQGEKTPDTITEPTIVVDKNGVITSYQIGDFDKDYYSVETLQKMAKQEADEFNANHLTEGEAIAVTVIRTEILPTDGTKVQMVLQFQNTDIYESYMKEINQTDSLLFYGTVSQGLMEGYEPETDLVSVKGDKTLSGEDYYGMEKRHILVTDEKGIIRCPGKILYVSEGVVLTEDGGADTSAVEGTAYILTK